MPAAPRVFTIPPGAPFLPTLVDALLDGELVSGKVYRDEPMALADLTLFLPTRRAARILAATLVDRMGGGAAVLPRIRPLGDVDDDGADGLTDPAELDLPPPLGGAERITALAGLVMDWRRRIAPDKLVTPAGDAITVPSSAADALHLSRDLLSVIDQGFIERVDWGGLARLVPENYSGWWQLTLDFLKIATEAWPAHLAEIGRMDPTAHRTAVLEAVAARLARDGHARPIVVAGSTGSQPATAALLAAVARLPNGAVVLPGLDLSLDADIFAALAAGEEDGAASHPQASMARLLSVIGLARAEVATLGNETPPLAERSRIVSAALLPAGRTDRWPEVASALAAEAARTEEALAGVSLAVAPNEAEEALTIAVALREVLEQPGARVALVTPDRGLARRVSSELARFGIETVDSAGEALAHTLPGSLALLIAECVASGLDPVTLVALMGHPLAAFGLPRPAARDAARVLEIGCLRGPRLAPGTAALGAAAERLVAGRSGLGVHPSVTRLNAADVAAARDLAVRLRAALAPLETRLAEAGPADHRSLLLAHLAALRAVACDETETDDRLFEGAAGAALARFYAGHIDAETALPVAPADLPAVLAALMEGERVRRSGADGRVSIWGQLEARLMTVDRLVVAGLDEGVWPAATDTGPWLSRPMRASLGFSPPEQRIGLAAHDFAQALGARDVVLVRSAKRGGAPTVPTRFLTRLVSLVGENATRAMEDRGAQFVHWATRIDDRPPERRSERPCPTPPLAARPKSLSVTEIETFIRDPYAVYAKHVLGLRPLPELGERPDFGTRGVAVHEALARFASEWTGPYDETAAERLVAIGREAFADLAAFPEVYALWWPRFEAAARWLIPAFEAERVDLVRHAEVSGRWMVVPGDDGFALSGRADRIDVLSDGSLSIVDFKSGTAPSDAQVATGLKPQLALEAAIAQRGGFAGVPAGEAVELVHVVLKGVAGKDAVKVYTGHSGKTVDVTLRETVAATEEKLQRLVAAYRVESKGYLSRAHPFKENEAADYDHLARVGEWSIGNDDEGGEAP